MSEQTTAAPAPLAPRRLTAKGLVRRNLRFHWRGNVAVILGVAVGAAVLCGALLVGDSLRGSLAARAERQRLGVDFVWTGSRFVRQEIATRLPGESCRPAIIFPATVRRVDTGDPDNVRESKATLIALDDDGLRQYGIDPSKANAWVSHALAQALDAPKHSHRLQIEFAAGSEIPRESLLGQRDPSKQLRSLERSGAVSLEPDDALSQFRLTPGTSLPRNIVVPLSEVQQSLKLPNRVNTFFVRGANLDALRSGFNSAMTLDDWGLSVSEQGEYLRVASRQSILEPAAEAAAMRAANALGWKAAPTLVYLANEIRSGKDSIPYSTIGALDPTLTAPLGPFLPRDAATLKDDEIVLADWADSPLKSLKPGATITLSYFDPDLHDGRLDERQATFTFRGFVPLSGVAADRHLTPDFPGITDKLSVRDWDPPFPYDNLRLRPRDDRFWKDHRATPKAYVTLAAGQRLWGSRFGRLTSVRVAPPPGANPPQSVEILRDKLLAELKPEEGGFVWDDLRQRFASASRGGQDFGMLFLGFSFFLIVAALVLVGLLTRLNLERRAGEIGLLLATGWRPGRVRRLFLVEGICLAALGAMVGSLAAIGFAGLMLRLLASLWPDQAVGAFLRLHPSPVSFAIGFIATLAISILTIVWALRSLRHVAPTALLRGEVTAAPAVNAKSSSKWGRIIGNAAVPVCAVGALASLIAGPSAPNPQVRGMIFFSAGSLLLAMALLLVRRWLKRERTQPVAQRGWGGVARLGAGNASRHPTRSLLTLGLIASAAFLLVAVESFRRQPERDFLEKTGGSGGFPLLVETELPLFRDLNGEGRADILDALQSRWQRQPIADRPAADRVRDAQTLLEQTTIYPFRLKGGDDASCLNLYQAARPRLLGASLALIDRGGFHFLATEAATPEEKANPWRLLAAIRADGAVPVFGEENTLTWMFKKGLGDEIEVPDEAGRAARLRIVGVFKDSIFPSELVMAASAFQRLYPREEGFSYFLVEPPSGKANEVAQLLRLSLARHAVEVTKTTDRLAAYLSVENTYLTTFQLLGGFGLVLGSLGLAVVLLRGVWERRGELALLRALGWRRRMLGWFVFAENGLLLLLGLATGVGAALASVLPHIIGGGSLPVARLATMLGLVLLAGLAAGAGAIRATLNAPLLPALRRE